MVAKPLTIVQMLPDLVTGGVEKVTLEIAEFMVQKGHSSIVISNGGLMVEELLQKGSEHICLPIGSKSPKSLLCIPALRKILIKEKVDILQLSSRVPAWVGLMAAKSISPKKRPGIVTTFHGFYSVNAYSAVMTKGDKVIAVSKPIKQHIKEKYRVPGKHVITINQGFDKEQFDPSLVKKDRVSALIKKWNLEKKERPFIILPGRFSPLKGHKLFLSALEKIKGLSWTAIFVGNENENLKYTEMLKQEASQKGLGQRVVFAGLCKDMPAAFKLCDLTVSASVYPESFGKIAVESQAMETPVIATAIGGSLETIIPGRTGWLFSPTDLDEFAAVLTEAVLNQEKRKYMGKKARKWVENNFTTELMCQKTLKVYRELLCNL
ncbi:MAG: glycosyltransferase family 4 protein [Desulfobacula sp.]|jgi:glycosyltransferase involved in cell wall biosynthesis|nr:glycosyltransferase family 4 protein [Desulfobacula sp.]